MLTRTDASSPAETTEPVAPADRLYLDGIVAGIVGAATIALWFLVLDTIGGQPLRTPSLLGTALFLSHEDIEKKQDITSPMGINMLAEMAPEEPEQEQQVVEPEKPKEQPQPDLAGEVDPGLDREAHAGHDDPGVEALGVVDGGPEAVEPDPIDGVSRAADNAIAVPRRLDHAPRRTVGLRAGHRAARRQPFPKQVQGRVPRPAHHVPQLQGPRRRGSEP